MQTQTGSIPEKLKQSEASEKNAVIAVYNTHEEAVSILLFIQPGPDGCWTTEFRYGENPTAQGD